LRLPLRTIPEVTRELASLYREAKAGRRDVSEVSKMANTLAILVRALEGSDLARRVEALETPQKKEAGS